MRSQSSGDIILEPVKWALACEKLLELRGVERGRRSNQEKHSTTVDECFDELGVSHGTGKKRLKLAADYRGLPKSEQQKAARSGSTFSR